MWKGSISFGLITIPVKLYAATESKDVRFNLLHEACRTPIRYRKWCPRCEQDVGSDELVKGYEYDRGRYVIVEPEDLDSLPIAAARTLDIVDFVRLEEIDPVYFDRTYYLEPGEGAQKAYALLRRAMEQTGRIAIARVVIRARESLAAIRVFKEGVLAVETMHFPDEVRSPAGLTGIVEPELREEEIEMAVNLVSNLSGAFDPTKFQNEYREALLQLIQAKVAGDEFVQVAARAPEAGRVVDLMEALRASIRKAEERRAAEALSQDGRQAPEERLARPEAPSPVPGAPGPGAGVPAPRSRRPVPGGPRVPVPTPSGSATPRQGRGVTSPPVPQVGAAPRPERRDVH